MYCLDPKVLFLDEPTSSLDEYNEILLINELFQLRKKIIFLAHKEYLKIFWSNSWTLNKILYCEKIKKVLIVTTNWMTILEHFDVFVH